MANLADTLMPPQPDDDGLLARTISGVRWVTIAVLLLLAIAQPVSSRAGVPEAAIVLAFAGYNVAVDLLRPHFSWLGTFARVALLDLPVVALVYWLGLRPSGPFFSLLVLTLFSAAASTTLRGSLLYTGVLMVVVAVCMPSFPLWSPDENGIREMVARLLTLAVVGVATTMLVRQVRREQESAQAARRRAESLADRDELRRGFFAAVSHDLRTPLTALSGALGMLEATGVERLRPDQRGLLANARRNTERLRVLIDDLLTLSRLEAGALEFVREPIDLRRLVIDSAASVRALLDAKEQPLEIHLPDGLLVEGDPRRLEQVVVNLLYNAHEHTPPGTRIAVSAGISGGEVVLSVSDNGPGLPTDDLEGIFRPYNRLHAESGGAGLGLAIAKGIVERHGGRVWAESERGLGTSLWIALQHREARQV